MSCLSLRWGCSSCCVPLSGSSFMQLAGPGTPLHYIPLSLPPTCLTPPVQFSQRNPPADGPRTTAEQQPHRCFRSAYLCLFLGGHGPGLFGGGQAVARHYTATSRPPLNPLGFDAGPEVLRVLIDSRSSPVHSLLNAEELAAACKQQSASWTSPAWQREAASASPIRRLQCRCGMVADSGSNGWAAWATAGAALLLKGCGVTASCYPPPPPLLQGLFFRPRHSRRCGGCNKL